MNPNDLVDEKDTDVTDDVDVDEALGEPEIEIVDDVPEEKKPQLEEPPKADLPDDDELENYSDKVQKRLKKLTFNYREEQRQREDAVRQKEEAIKYARQLTEQNRRLLEQVNQGQGAYVDQAKQRVEAQIEAAKEEYRKAYEAGDTDKVLEAQEKLSAAQFDKQRFANYRPQKIQPEPAPQMVEPEPTAPELTPLQKEWSDANKWFGEHRGMTGYAYGIHEDLVRSGVDPNTRTYYDKIDSEMRKQFPDFFDDGTVDDVSDDPPAKKPAPVVASAKRSAKSPRKIKLTSTQVAIAKRLGVSPEQYAAQLLKEAKSNG